MISPRPHPILPLLSRSPPQVKVGRFQYIQIPNFSVFVNTWQSCLITSIPQLIWNWEFYSLFTYNQGPIRGGSGPKEMVPNDLVKSQQQGPTTWGGQMPQPWKKEVERNLRCPAIKQLPQGHGTSRRSTSNVRFPSREDSTATRFLTLSGRGMWQHLKVNAKGRAWDLKGSEGRATNPGQSRDSPLHSGLPTLHTAALGPAPWSTDHARD